LGRFSHALGSLSGVRFSYFGFLGIATLAGMIVTRILFPANNPSRNVSLSQGTTPQFFLWDLKPRSWARILSSRPRFSQLAQSHDTYLAEISAADSAALLRSVSAEVLKVSYIRQMKTDRLRALAQVLAVGVVIFVSLIVLDAMSPKAVQPVIVQVQGPVSLISPPVSPPPVNPPAGAPEHNTVDKAPPRSVPSIKSLRKTR
jgi:hypothetical protein